MQLSTEKRFIRNAIPSGGPCRLAPDPNMTSVQRIDVDINDNLAPKVAHQWPRRWVVRDDFAVSCWQDDFSSYEPGLPIINRGGNHAMEVVRRGHPNASKIAGTPWAIDADFVLSNSGRMYSPHDGRLLFPAAGENYPAELRRMAGDGRMVVSAWPYTTPVIDTAVGKPLFSDAIGGYRLVSQPAGSRAFVGGRNLTVSPGRSATSREYGKDRFPSPTAVPGPGVAIPPDHLLRWVKLVIRGEYDANNELQKWDEPRWEAERQALARSVPPTPDYPFPGPIATDKNYWLYEEYTELLRAQWLRGLNAEEALPLLERLLKIEPTADLYLTRARLRLNTGDLDGGVRDIGEAEKRLGNRCSEVWFLTLGVHRARSHGECYGPPFDTRRPGAVHTWAESGDLPGGRRGRPPGGFPSVVGSEKSPTESRGVFGSPTRGLPVRATRGGAEVPGRSRIRMGEAGLEPADESLGNPSSSKDSPQGTTRNPAHALETDPLTAFVASLTPDQKVNLAALLLGGKPPG